MQFTTFGLVGSCIILGSMFLTALFYKSSTGQLFNPFNHFISELGYVGVSQFALLFNLGTFVGGLFLAFFMVGLRNVLKSNLAKVTSIIGLVACLLGACIGLFPMNNVTPHIVIAMSFFFISTLTMILYSYSIYSDPQRIFPKFFALYGLLVFLFFMFFLFNPFDTSAVTFTESFTQENIANLDNIRPNIWGIAILEWLSVLSIILWVILISIFLKKSKLAN